MSDIEVRAIRDEDIPAWVRCVGTAFHVGSDVSDDRVEFARMIMNDLSRRVAAFVDGVLCGTAGSFSLQPFSWLSTPRSGSRRRGSLPCGRSSSRTCSGRTWSARM